MSSHSTYVTCFLNEESTVFCCTSELPEVTELNLIYFYFLFVHDYVPFVVWTMTFVVRFRYSQVQCQ